MADEQGPDMYRETRHGLAVLFGIVGMSFVLVLENGPPTARGLLLSLLSGVFIIVCVLVFLHTYSGGTVFGYASTYPLVVGAISGVATLWVSTTGRSARLLTVVALCGIVATSVAGGFALGVTHLPDAPGDAEGGTDGD